MKRSPLIRRTPLKPGTGALRTNALLTRSARLRAHRRPRTTDPAWDAFKTVQSGFCAMCGVGPAPVRRHHVVTEQTIRREHGDPWDLRWGMWVGAFDFVCLCHRRHHNAVARIPFDLVPAPAIEAAVELLGAERAIDYFGCHYAPARTERS